MSEDAVEARVRDLEEALQACRSSKAMMLYLKKKGLWERAEALHRANERMGETNAWRQTIIDSVVRPQPQPPRSPPPWKSETNPFPDYAATVDEQRRLEEARRRQQAAATKEDSPTGSP